MYYNDKKKQITQYLVTYKVVVGSFWKRRTDRKNRIWRQIRKHQLSREREVISWNLKKFISCQPEVRCRLAFLLSKFFQTKTAGNRTLFTRCVFYISSCDVMRSKIIRFPGVCSRFNLFFLVGSKFILFFGISLTN